MADDQEMLLAHARELMEQGDAEMLEARRLLEQRLREAPDEYEPLDLEAQILVRMNEAELALRLLEEYTRYYPHNDRARARMAWVLWGLGQQSDAIAEMRATLERHPDSIDACRHLARWMLELKDYDGAAEVAAKGLAIAANDEELLLLAGKAAAHRNNEADARSAFQAVLTGNPANEKAARLYAEFLLDKKHSEEALGVLDRFLGRDDAHGETLMRGMDAAFRTHQQQRAIQLAIRIAGDHSLEDEKVAHDSLSLIHQNAGLQGGDEVLFKQLEAGNMSDLFAVEFLERSGQRENRGNLIRIYKTISRIPLRYPRTMTRFLSTYSAAPLAPGTVDKWISTHQAEIQQNTTLWAGVGAWYVSKQKWREAASHLSAYESRPDVKPWMILLLGRSLEALGDTANANQHYRRAVAMPPDHSEPSIRSRLAFNMAMEDMPGTAQIILLDATERGKKLASVEDLIRIFAVESLLAAEKIPELPARKALFDDTLRRMKELAKTDRFANATTIIRIFRNKAMEILSRPGRT